eukprot:CAMPEP_0176498956 /NCGR_PEP_ID=MMETSP0200_2-20121128/12639_1 /TAXON_ID=947934 /ORGANISM="Chaetoceros sp., Strain GSL56" /LENGTH=792 /DNA_ID=CAMNT_0017897281 /DNA_START=204 /DNA_END=2579 /DNA_ORIENTATION=-
MTASTMHSNSSSYHGRGGPSNARPYSQQHGVSRYHHHRHPHGGEYDYQYHPGQRQRPLEPNNYRHPQPSITMQPPPLPRDHALQQPLPTPPPLSYFQKCIPQTRTIAHYKRIEQIGEGTYGQVYKAFCLSTQRIVALKKIRLTSVSTEGLPRTVIREIKILKALRHENMVQMLEVVSSKGCEFLDEEDEHKEDKRKRLQQQQQQPQEEEQSQRDKMSQQQSDRPQSDYKSSSHNNNDLTTSTTTTSSNTEKYMGNLFLVLEYISHDLSGILDMGVRFTPVQSKCIFKQLLSVLEYMHDKRYVHRDLKSSNILIDERYHVKLADFGLARSLDDEYAWQLDQQERKFTNKVVTIWYRCPELLLGATDYDEKVDIWSAGCILAELLLGKALFPGTNDMEQLRLIFKLMGTPGEHNWEGIQEYPKIKSKDVEIGEPMRAELRDKYGSDERFTSSPSSLALIERLLELDPKKRWRAKQALGSQYFRAKPQVPADPQELGVIPIKGDSHEFQTKPIRKQAKVVAQKASADAKKRGEDAKEAYENAYRDYLANAAENGMDQLVIDAANNNDAARDPEDEKVEREDRKKRKRERSSSKDRQGDENYDDKTTQKTTLDREERQGKNGASNEDKGARKAPFEGDHYIKKQDGNDRNEHNEKGGNLDNLKLPSEQGNERQKYNRDDYNELREEKRRSKEKSRDEKDRKEKSRSGHKSRRDDETRRSRERGERKHEDSSGRERSKSRERNIRMGYRQQGKDREGMYGSNWRMDDMRRDPWARGDGYHEYPQKFEGGPPHPSWQS